jgi:hypothetical protein
MASRRRTLDHLIVHRERGWPVVSGQFKSDPAAEVSETISGMKALIQPISRYPTSLPLHSAD